MAKKTVHPPITIDLNQFKLHVRLKDRLELTLLFNSPSRRFYISVIDCHTLKPLDMDALLEAARDTGAIVTAESNIRFGGLGSAVAEALVEHHPVPMKIVAVGDFFTESGPYLELIEKYGLSAGHIARAVEAVVARKGT